MRVYNDPASLEEIEVDRTAKNKILDDKWVFITWAPVPEFRQTTVFIYQDLKKVIAEPDIFNIPVAFAQTSEYKNYTVVDCKDATEKASVILLKIGEPTSISTEETALFCRARMKPKL